MRLGKSGFFEVVSGLFRRSSDDDEFVDSRVLALDSVRQLMLDTLGADGALLAPSLAARIRFADSASSLWFARAEVVAVLAAVHGEVKAVRLVQALTPGFAGLLPTSLMSSRPSRRPGTTAASRLAGAS